MITFLSTKKIKERDEMINRVICQSNSRFTNILKMLTKLDEDIRSSGFISDDLHNRILVISRDTQSLKDYINDIHPEYENFKELKRKFE